MEAVVEVDVDSDDVAENGRDDDICRSDGNRD
jgi:hypothetical protein